jgi:hypothetical protein
MIQAKNSKELVKVLKELLGKDELERTLKRLGETEVALTKIEKELTGIQKLLKTVIDYLTPKVEARTSISDGLSNTKKDWEERKDENSPSLSLRSIESAIVGTVKRETKEILEKTEVMEKVFAILKVLRKLVKEVNEKRLDLQVLMGKGAFTEDDIKNLNKLKKGIEFLIKEAKNLGADPLLIDFLENAMSSKGVSFEGLSEDIVLMLEKHDLKKLITLHLTIQGS